MTKTILYVHSPDIFGITHKCMQYMGADWTVKTYCEEGRLSQKYNGVGIQLDVIMDLLRIYQNSLDLIVVDGQVNNSFHFPKVVRESQLTKAKILVAPVFGYLSKGLEQAVANSNADFGLDIPIPAEDVKIAFENIFSNRTGGYIFNRNLYEDRDGILVPKS